MRGVESARARARRRLDGLEQVVPTGAHPPSLWKLLRDQSCGFDRQRVIGEGDDDGRREPGPCARLRFGSLAVFRNTGPWSILHRNPVYRHMHCNRPDHAAGPISQQRVAETADQRVDQLHADVGWLHVSEIRHVPEAEERGGDDDGPRHIEPRNPRGKEPLEPAEQKAGVDKLLGRR